MSTAFEGMISVLDVRSSGKATAGSLGRCTIENPSSSLEESVSNPMATSNCLGLCTSVVRLEAIESTRVAASSILFRSCWYSSLCMIVVSCTRSAVVLLVELVGGSRSISCGRSREARMVGRIPPWGCRVSRARHTISRAPSIDQIISYRVMRLTYSRLESSAPCWCGRGLDETLGSAGLPQGSLRSPPTCGIGTWKCSS
jgi:hypothetical protein